MGSAVEKEQLVQMSSAHSNDGHENWPHALFSCCAYNDGDDSDVGFVAQACYICFPCVLMGRSFVACSWASRVSAVAACPRRSTAACRCVPCRPPSGWQWCTSEAALWTSSTSTGGAARRCWAAAARALCSSSTTSPPSSSGGNCSEW